MTKQVIIEHIELDAKGKAFGRLASQIAHYLMGKHKASYAPNVVAPIRVSVKNLAQVQFTGTKLDTKIIYKHTGYTGNVKQQTLRQAFAHSPEKTLLNAVRRMLPKNRLQTHRLKNLSIVA